MLLTWAISEQFAHWVNLSFSSLFNSNLFLIQFTTTEFKLNSTLFIPTLLTVQKTSVWKMWLRILNQLNEITAILKYVESEKMLKSSVTSWPHQFLFNKEMLNNPKNRWKSMNIANIDRESLHIFWTTRGI